MTTQSPERPRSARQRALRGCSVVLLAWAGAWLLPLPAAAQGACRSDALERPPESGGDDGLGGTGIAAQSGPEPDGLGGTGATPGSDPDGLGGTGIVGTITGFGSVCVNGIEVLYDAKTVVEIGGKPTFARNLALGQVAQVEAERGAGGVRARRIAVRSAVAGPIAARAVQDGELRVLGQRVVLPPDAVVSDRARGERMAASELAVGQFVEVSGLRRSDGAIVASRVERAASGELQLTGRVARAEAGELQIGELRVKAPPSAALSAGDLVRVAGVLSGEALVASSAVREPALPFASRIRELVLEGFVDSSRGRDGFRFAGVDVDLSGLDLDAGFSGLDADRRVRVSGRLADGGRLRAERVEVRDAAGAAGRWREIEGADLRGGRPGREDADRKDGDRNDDDRKGDDYKDDDRKNDDREDGPRSDGGAEREDRMDRSGRGDRGERMERPERVERPERPERSERPEQPERAERPERSGRR